MNTTNSSAMNSAGRRSAGPYRSNILGATGLPKAILAGMFQRDGLFGNDSSLTREEQSVLQSRLPAIRGLAAPAPVKPLTPRLSVLADLVDALIHGADASVQQARALRAGFDVHAAQEVGTVIDNVFTVFGPFPGKIPDAAATGRAAELAVAA